MIKIINRSDGRRPWWVDLIVVIFPFLMGLILGLTIMRWEKEAVIKKMQFRVEEAKKSVAGVETKEKFFLDTLKMLAEGGQFEGVDITGKGRAIEKPSELKKADRASLIDQPRETFIAEPEGRPSVDD